MNGVLSTNASSGIEVWNVKSTSPSVISGGSVTGVENGVFVNNYDGYPSTGSNAPDGGNASLSSITITGCVTGIYVKDNSLSTHAGVNLAIGSGVVVTGGTTGLLIENSAASAGASLSDIAFSGQSGNYITLLSNANNIDATLATFGGNTGAGATLAQNFAIEDKISHKIDNGALGFVLVKAGNDFVTVNSFASPATTTPQIQRGVDAASNGFTVNVGPGSFNDNVIVNKEVNIAGQGQGTTNVYPATSNPNCGGAGGGSLCAGGSYIFLVQSNNVTIHDLTADGDNTTLTSGTVAGGADLDARNGIITNHSLGVYQNLEVYNVTIQNIYLRGIYASSGGSFNFHENTVANVQANPASIGMFNFGGSGAFTNNTVSDCNDGIASNWSTGTTYTGNTVSSSGSGIHTDNNGGSGGVADIISNNTVLNSDLNGYGIWVFAPYLNVQVTNNIVTNVDVGMAAAGQQAAVTVSFSGNEIDGQNKVNSTGMYVTTSLFGFGSSNVTVDFNNNYVINNAADGFYLESEAGQTLTLNAHNNSITGNAPYNVERGIGASGAGTFNADMTCNWWGSNVPATVLATFSGTITYIPYLSNGTDNGGRTRLPAIGRLCPPCALVLSSSTGRNQLSGIK